MRLGLQISNFPLAEQPDFAARLGRMARLAEDVGYASVSVMDHFFQIPHVGSVSDPMLESYTTLGFLAASTSRVQLGAVVSAVTYHQPAVLVKQVTTLDVLSAGRAFLGMGAGYFEREHLGLGIPFPPAAERLRREEEALQIAHWMWGGKTAPYEGRYYRLAEPLNVPAPVTRPHPPIIIGGGGERQTLRLVAKYGDACNLSTRQGTDAVRHKLDVLRSHCQREGRDFASIKKTVQFALDVGPNGSNAGSIIDRLGALAELGIEQAIGAVQGMEELTPLEVVGRDIIPRIAAL